MGPLSRLLVSCVAMGAVATGVRAQDLPAPKAADPLERLVEAYRAGPIGERVAVTYGVPGGAEVHSVVTVRLDAGSADSAHPRPARLRLTLGRLEVYAEGEAMCAVLRGESRTCFESTRAPRLTPGSLRGALPPLPLPQLHWALGDEAARSSVHPYGLATTPDGADADGTLRFRASDGVVLVRTDGRSGRAKSIVWNGGDASVLRLEFAPMEAGEPAGWAIDLKGRTRVPTLAELQSRAPVSPVGVRMPELGLVDAELRNVTGAELRGQASRSGASGGGPVVLMAYMANADGSPSEAIGRDAAAALDAAGRVPETGLLVAVGALPEGTLKPEKLGESAAAVAALPGEAAKVRVLFSPSARGFMEKWEPGAGVLLLVVRADGAVGGLVECDGRDAQAIAADLRASIGPAAPK